MNKNSVVISKSKFLFLFRIQMTWDGLHETWERRDMITRK